MADAKQQTKARNGKPSDVNRMKQKNEASERNTPVPSAKPERTPTGEVVPTPSSAPARMQSGGGMGDYLDMIMSAAFGSDNVQRSFGDNAPSTMTPEDIAAMQARDASLQGFTDQTVDGVDVSGNAGNGNGDTLDPALAPDVDKLADDGYSIGQISAALGGVVGAAAIARYLATRKGKASPDMIDEVMAQTDEPLKGKSVPGVAATAQAGPDDLSEGLSTDKAAQAAVEGRTNVQRSAQPSPNSPASSDMDMLIDETMQGPTDRSVMKAIEGSDTQRTAPNRHSGQDATSSLIDRAASMRPTEAVTYLKQNGVNVTPELIEQIVNGSVGRAATRAIK